MKKLVCFIYLLSGIFCTTAMAQTSDYNILKIEGMVPSVDGTTTYYLKNVGTGLYVSYGGEWGKHCKESRAAHPFTLESNGDGIVALKSLAGYLESATLWMDWELETSKWTLQPVGGEYVNQYYLVGDYGRALTSVGNSAGLLNMTPLENKASQRWIFITEDEIRNNRMPNATKDKPFDVTPLIKGAGFDLVDIESNLGDWANFDDNKKLDPWHCGICPEDANDYNYCGIINGGTNALTITYTVTLPAGTYSYSFEGFYKYMKKVVTQSYVLGSASGDPETTLTDNGNMTATVSVNGTSHTLTRHTNDAVYEENYVSSEVAAAEFRDNDTYKQNGTFYLSSAQEVSIAISKASTTANQTSGNKFWGDYTTTSYPNQIFIDDFTLLYFGNEQLAEDEVDEGALKDSYVDANIDEVIDNLYPDATEEEKESLKTEIKEEIETNSGTGTGSTDISDVLQQVEDKAEEIEQEQEQEEALGGITTDENGNLLDENGNVIEGGSADLESFIKNPSFEKTDLTGWTVSDNEGGDIGVKHYSENTTTGTDESYLFNSWPEGVSLTQTLTGLPNGVYKMTVSLASDADNTVVLIGNGSEREVTLTKGAGTFEDFNVKFRVTDGTATIGVVGGNAGANWYKADNFRLELLNDHLVLNETDGEAIVQARTVDYWYANLTLYRTIKPGTWSTFVVPFDIPASSLGGWEVKELQSSTLNGDHITLTFVDAADGIKAGVPYMVRNQTMETTMNEFTMTDVLVNTELTIPSTSHVDFVGTYVSTYVPQGSFFISSNVFYQAADNTNTVKAFRAYFTPTSANARALGYRFGSNEDNTTSIDNGQLTNDNEVTTVAIYNERGIRLSEMQPGLNILHMSDGSVVKVMIK